MLLTVLGFLEFDNRREFDFILVCSVELFFKLAKSEAEGLQFGVFLDVSMLFNILVCLLVVYKPSLRMRSNMFNELRLSLRKEGW